LYREQRILPYLIVAVGIAAGGYLAGDGYYRARSLDRTVVVKGLSEREAPANIAIWPIRFTEAANDLDSLYAKLESDAGSVLAFLANHQFPLSEITVNPPAIVDKLAQAYGNTEARFRFSAIQSVNVYTTDVERVRGALQDLNELGRSGVVISGDDYQSRTQFLFTGLNDLKPAMIEEATRKAREVAQKFAEDSGSILGRIKTARQGQFSIVDRDSNTPHIKKVRVVSTIEYYLSD